MQGRRVPWGHKVQLCFYEKLMSHVNRLTLRMADLTVLQNGPLVWKLIGFLWQKNDGRCGWDAGCKEPICTRAEQLKAQPLQNQRENYF